MVSYLLILLFIIAGILSYKNVVIGIILLLFLNCTFMWPDEFVQINLIEGSISISDVIILIIFTKTIKDNYKKTKNDQDLKMSFLIMGWFLICGILSNIAGDSTLREFYRLVMRISIFWILPITVKNLSKEGQKMIVVATVIIAVAVSLLQIYILYFNEEIQLVANLYYQFKAYDNPEAMAAGVFSADSLSEGNLPRLYPHGALMCQMVFAYLVCIMLNYQLSNAKNIIYISSSIILSIFIITLGGRSNTISAILSVLLAVYIKVRYSKTIKFSARSLFLIGIIIMASIFIINNLNVVDYFTSQVQKTQEQGLSQMYSARMSDNEDAFKVLLTTPIWGIGKSNLGSESGEGSGYDVHPLLSIALLGGIPAVFLICMYYVRMFKVYSKVLNVSIVNSELAISAGCALFLGTLLSVMNTTPIFLYAFSQVPFGIYSGIVLSKNA